MKTRSMRLSGGPWAGRLFYLSKPGNNALSNSKRESLAFTVGADKGRYDLVTGVWKPL